jgi:hypothetical protein
MVNATTQINDWEISPPFYNGAGFDKVTGTYTVPESGRYRITANVSYRLSEALTVSLGAGVDPAFVLSRTSPVATDLVVGQLPILDVNIALELTLRAVLQNATVTLSADVELTDGDVISLLYVADGLTVTVNISDSEHPTFWSVHKIADAIPH